MQRDIDGAFQALTVVPKVEGGQAIAAAVRRRKKESRTCTNAQFNRPDIEIIPYRQRARRKFNVEHKSTGEMIS